MTESEALTIMKKAFSCYDRRMRGTCQKADCDDCNLKEYNTETIHFAFEMIMHLLEKDDDSRADIDKAIHKMMRNLVELLEENDDIDPKSYLIGALDLGDELSE